MFSESKQNVYIYICINSIQTENIMSSVNHLVDDSASFILFDAVEDSTSKPCVHITLQPHASLLQINN